MSTKAYRKAKKRATRDYQNAMKLVRRRVVNNHRSLLEQGANVTGKYILYRGKRVVPCPHLLAWGRWIGHCRKDVIVKQECFTVLGWIKPLMVSTVFLGLDHRFLTEGPPILFETMIFAPHGPNGVIDNEIFGNCDRVCSLGEARQQHERAKLLALDWIRSYNPARGGSGGEAELGIAPAK